MPAILKRASRWGGGVATTRPRDSRLKIAGMTTMKFAHHGKTFGDGSSGQALLPSFFRYVTAIVKRSTKLRGLPSW
jgi:hypothetical protein